MALTGKQIFMRKTGVSGAQKGPWWQEEEGERYQTSSERRSEVQVPGFQTLFFFQKITDTYRKKNVLSPFEEAAGALKKNLGHQGPCYT